MVVLITLATAFGFQGAELGTSEAQLRRLVPTLACTGEISNLDLTPEESAAGTKKCAPTEMIGDSRVTKWASVGDYSGSIRYYLTKGILARIEFWPDYPAAD